MDTLVLAVTLFTCLAVFLCEGARKHWLLDLLCHFRIHYFLTLLICGALILYLNLDLFFLTLAAFLLNLFRVLPSESGFFKHKRKLNNKSFKLLSLNVLHSNKEHKQVIDYILKQGPDFVSLYETGASWLETIDYLKTKYPFSYFVSSEEAFGQAFFSKYPFNVCEKGLRDTSAPYFCMEVGLSGYKVNMVAAHPQSPLSKKRSVHRNNQLKELAALFKSSQGPKLLFGDLNITPYSPFFKDLCSETNFEFQALRPTWPAPYGLIGIPIDHFLHTPDVVVEKKRIGPYMGSDHYPVLVEFYLL
ncbi:MAG: endonuclease/exonuclease/phosphatase family protein [Bacteriovoracaceae bacterium]